MTFFIGWFLLYSEGGIQNALLRWMGSVAGSHKRFVELSSQRYRYLICRTISNYKIPWVWSKVAHLHLIRVIKMTHQVRLRIPANRLLILYVTHTLQHPVSDRQTVIIIIWLHLLAIPLDDIPSRNFPIFPYFKLGSRGARTTIS